MNLPLKSPREIIILYSLSRGLIFSDRYVLGTKIGINSLFFFFPHPGINS